MHKINLTDLSILIPVRIESTERMANLRTLISVINRNILTNIFVLEGDSEKRFMPPKNVSNLTYEYIFDKEIPFNRTYYRNRLLKLARTPYAGIWDTDAIIFPSQMEKAVIELRNDRTAFVFPYDSRYLMLNESFSKLFRKYEDFEILNAVSSFLRSMNGYYSTGGAFIVNVEQYLRAGGDNENFCGWDSEDDERVKRMEILGFPVRHVNGPMFHLWHPKLKGSRFANRDVEIRNRLLHLKTCASDKESLLKEISKWR